MNNQWYQCLEKEIDAQFFLKPCTLYKQVIDDSWWVQWVQCAVCTFLHHLLVPCSRQVASGALRLHFTQANGHSIDPGKDLRWAQLRFSVMILKVGGEMLQMAVWILRHFVFCTKKKCSPQPGRCSTLTIIIIIIIIMFIEFDSVWCFKLQCSDKHWPRSLGSLPAIPTQRGWLPTCGFHLPSSTRLLWFKEASMSTTAAIDFHLGGGKNI